MAWFAGAPTPKLDQACETMESLFCLAPDLPLSGSCLTLSDRPLSDSCLAPQPFHEKLRKDAFLSLWKLRRREEGRGEKAGGQERKGACFTAPVPTYGFTEKQESKSPPELSSANRGCGEVDSKKVDSCDRLGNIMNMDVVFHLVTMKCGYISGVAS